MKRDELIAELKQLPDDAEVYIVTSCGCCSYDEDDFDVYQAAENSNRYRIG